MKILVTGSSGFIGHATSLLLGQYGYVVTGFDLPECNILDEAILSEAIKDNDVVIHFAAMANLNECFSDLDKMFAVNIKGTYNVAKFCSLYGKRLIFISTCCVYGNLYFHMPVKEDENIRTCSDEPYACSKMAGEYILQGMPTLNYTTLRIGTTYGVGMRKELFIFIALESVLTGKTIYIDGTGKQTRQYINIEDLRTGILATVDDGGEKTNRQIINICADMKHSVLDVIKTAEAVTKRKGVIDYQSDRYGQIMHEDLAIEKAKALLNWTPTILLAGGMDYLFRNDYRLRQLAT